MVETAARAVYSVVLLAVVFFCAREVWAVWFDRGLQIGQFTATKDGADAASVADTFRRLVVQQQKTLFDLYNPTKAGPGDFRVSAQDVLTIHLSDLARMPGSALDSLKIEAAGVNVTSVLTTLRRLIVAPNEITGNISQINEQISVSAGWTNAPAGRGGADRLLMLPPQTSLQGASFDLACRILFEQVPPDDAPFKDVEKNDFCTFSRALSQFRSYVVARDGATNDAETSAANKLLEAAGLLVDRLIAKNTTLIYAHKLGGYIQLEMVASVTDANATAIKPHLDKAEKLFSDYINRLAALDPKAKDSDVQVKLASLASRRGAITASENYRQVDASTFLKSVNSATEDATKKAAAASEHPLILHPGASVSGASSKAAGSLGCFVAAADGRKFFITLAYALGSVGSEVVSPALIDTAGDPRTVGKVALVDGALALVGISETLAVANDPINQLTPDPPPIGTEVRVIGKTSGPSSAKITASHVTIRINTDIGPLTLEGLLQIDRSGLPGDIGGPVLDDQNRLIGLLAAGSSQYGFVLALKPFFEDQHLALLP